METIIQGDNKPVVLEFDESLANVEQFSAILYGSTTVLKEWGLEDISISGNTMKLPLTQEETMKISSQTVALEIKMVANGDIEFFETITLKVKSRRDRHIFGVTGDQL